jgi:predicted nucleotidyltransferase
MDAVELLSYKGSRKLFETLHGYPKRQFSINELSKAAGVPFATCWKLVWMFEKAQVATVATIGKSRAVSYNESPFSALVAKILRMSASVQSISVPGLKRKLKAKKGVREAYLFGSVVTGNETLESDVDVALLAENKLDLPSLITEMREKYGVNLMPLEFRSKAELDDFLSKKKKVRLV